MSTKIPTIGSFEMEYLLCPGSATGVSIEVITRDPVSNMLESFRMILLDSFSNTKRNGETTERHEYYSELANLFLI